MLNILLFPPPPSACTCVLFFGGGVLEGEGKVANQEHRTYPVTVTGEGLQGRRLQSAKIFE